MFTGIIEEVGTVKQVSPNLAIEACRVLEGTKVGDSIAINGVCLTVISLSPDNFSVDVMPETLRRSALGRLQYSDKVNLERALIVGGRLGGHFVLGHVDGTGNVIEIVLEENARAMKISAPAEVMPYIVNKGFIAVDGVSLTTTYFDGFSFAVSLTNYTLEHTTLGDKRPGDIINLEADIVAKYIESFKEREKHGLTFDSLKEHGFTEAI
ncbi:MAG: riboflavin synthase [Chloroflexota bacterium]|nr:riboflavin synthase [Chloroflexota bacterium]